MNQKSVAIFGVSNLFREGLQVLLRRSKFTVIRNTANLDDPEAGAVPLRPDLAIYALSDHEDATRRIQHLRVYREATEGVRLVLLADSMSTELLRDAAAAGVQAVLSKNITADVLQRALELVILGQQLFPGQPDGPPPRTDTSLVPFARPVLTSVPGSGSVDGRGNADGSTKALIHSIFAQAPATERTMSLSERERQILRCLMDGNSNKTIARHLSITEATVKVHIKGLLRKIRVTNRTQAAVWGLNNSDIFDEAGSLHAEPDQVPASMVMCQAAS